MCKRPPLWPYCGIQVIDVWSDVWWINYDHTKKFVWIYKPVKVSKGASSRGVFRHEDLIDTK